MSRVCVALITMCLSLLATSLPAMDTVRILANESMPFNGIKDGKPAGMTYEILQHAEWHGAPKFEYEFGLPWVRAQNMIRDAGDSPVAIVPLTRTPQREDSYLWIESLITHYARVSVSESNHLKRLQKDPNLALGIIRGSALIPSAKAKGYTNLIEVDNALQNAKMLLSQRMTGLIESKYVDTYNWIHAGGDPADLRFVPIGKPLHIYIAANPRFPEHLKAQMQSAFADMKRRGCIDRILRKWESAQLDH